MGCKAKPADSDAALLPKEVGARLRQLRREAGLTQADVALRMCRPGPGGKSYVCQIEQGYMPGLTFNAAMDFLKACGAKVSAVEDVFDACTKRPPVPEERTRKRVADAAVGLPLFKQARVVWYDLFHEPKTGKRETPEQQYDRRVREAKGQARAIRLERRLHRVFNDILNELHVGSRPYRRSRLGLADGPERSTRRNCPDGCGRYCSGIIGEHTGKRPPEGLTTVFGENKYGHPGGGPGACPQDCKREGGETHARRGPAGRYANQTPPEPPRCGDGLGQTCVFRFPRKLLFHCPANLRDVFPRPNAQPKPE
jgi:transcriptional regulator with XRE-family HTH domain